MRRIAFVAFQECEVRGNWREGAAPAGPAGRWFIAEDDDCQVWLVRQDGLRRAFAFKKGANITMTSMMLSFESSNIANELSVDEDEQAGKQTSSKLRFT